MAAKKLKTAKKPKPSAIPDLRNASVLGSFGADMILVDDTGKLWHLDIAQGTIEPVLLGHD